MLLMSCSVVFVRVLRIFMFYGAKLFPHNFFDVQALLSLCNE